MALAEKPRETEVNVNTACARPNFNIKFKTKQAEQMKKSDYKQWLNEEDDNAVDGLAS